MQLIDRNSKVFPQCQTDALRAQFFWPGKLVSRKSRSPRPFMRPVGGDPRSTAAYLHKCATTVAHARCMCIVHIARVHSRDSANCDGPNSHARVRATWVCFARVRFNDCRSRPETHIFRAYEKNGGKKEWDLAFLKNRRELLIYFFFFRAERDF